MEGLKSFILDSVSRGQSTQPRAERNVPCQNFQKILIRKSFVLSWASPPLLHENLTVSRKLPKRKKCRSKIRSDFLLENAISSPTSVYTKEISETSDMVPKLVTRSPGNRKSYAKIRLMFTQHNICSHNKVRLSVGKSVSWTSFEICDNLSYGDVKCCEHDSLVSVHLGWVTEAMGGDIAASMVVWAPPILTPAYNDISCDVRDVAYADLIHGMWQMTVWQVWLSGTRLGYGLTYVTSIIIPCTITYTVMAMVPLWIMYSHYRHSRYAYCACIRMANTMCTNGNYFKGNVLFVCWAWEGATQTSLLYSVRRP